MSWPTPTAHMYLLEDALTGRYLQHRVAELEALYLGVTARFRQMLAGIAASQSTMRTHATAHERKVVALAEANLTRQSREYEQQLAHMRLDHEAALAKAENARLEAKAAGESVAVGLKARIRALENQVKVYAHKLTRATETTGAKQQQEHEVAAGPSSGATMRRATSASPTRNKSPTTRRGDGPLVRRQGTTTPVTSSGGRPMAASGLRSVSAAAALEVSAVPHESSALSVATAPVFGSGWREQAWTTVAVRGGEGGVMDGGSPSPSSPRALPDTPRTQRDASIPAVPLINHHPVSGNNKQPASGSRGPATPRSTGTRPDRAGHNYNGPRLEHSTLSAAMRVAMRAKPVLVDMPASWLYVHQGEVLLSWKRRYFALRGGELLMAENESAPLAPVLTFAGADGEPASVRILDAAPDSYQDAVSPPLASVRGNGIIVTVEVLAPLTRQQLHALPALDGCEVAQLRFCGDNKRSALTWVTALRKLAL